MEKKKKFLLDLTLKAAHSLRERMIREKLPDERSLSRGIMGERVRKKSETGPKRPPTDTNSGVTRDWGKKGEPGPGTAKPGGKGGQVAVVDCPERGKKKYLGLGRPER